MQISFLGITTDVTIECKTFMFVIREIIFKNNEITSPIIHFTYVVLFENCDNRRYIVISHKNNNNRTDLNV